MAGLSEVACLYVDFGGRFVADFESCAYECEGAWCLKPSRWQVGAYCLWQA